MFKIPHDIGSREDDAVLRMRVLEAVERNDTKLLQEALQSITMATGYNGLSTLNNALISAASKGYQDCVAMLLTFGAECDQADPYSNTALILASERGHTRVVKLLLEEGSRVERTDTQTRTSLHWAAMNGHEEIVQLLLEFGALPDEKDNVYGFTPVMLASRQGHTEVLRLLLQTPCNVSKTDIDGETALFDAVRNNHLKCMELLLQVDGDINHRDKYGRTVLLTAVLWHRKEAAVKLIHANCRLEVAGSISYVGPSEMRKCTPIEGAVLETNLKMSQILATAGARLGALYKHACFPDTLRAFGMEKDMIEWLIRIVRRPRSLRELCRIRIRRQLSTKADIRGDIDQLPLPASIQEYLTIPELNDLLVADCPRT